MKKRFISLALAALIGGCCLAIGCKNEPSEGDITVYMPDGAPAIALAGLMQADTEEDGVSYRVVQAKLIGQQITYTDMDKNADLCVLPLTAATASVGEGEKYQMLGAVTHGNLYIISKNTALSYTAENLHTLVGKTVGVKQLASTPGLIVKALLAKNNLPFQDLSSGGEVAADKVNLRPFSEPLDMETLIKEGVEAFVLAEPAVTAQKAGGFVTVGDIQALYGEEGYSQAVLVAKKTLIEEKSEWLNGFLNDLEESERNVTTLSGQSIVDTIQAHMEDAGYATELKAGALTAEALSRCGIRFERTRVCKAKTEAFLLAANGVNDKTTIPQEKFYWLGEE